MRNKSQFQQFDDSVYNILDSKCFSLKDKEIDSQPEENDKKYQQQLGMQIDIYQRYKKEMNSDYYNDENQDIPESYQKTYQKDIENFLSKIRLGLSQQQLKFDAEQLRDKYGPAGINRIRLMNYYIGQTINLSLNDFQKYLLISAIKEQGICGEVKTGLDCKIVELMGLESQQKRENFSMFTKIMFEENGRHYLKCCENLYKQYINLLQCASKIQTKISAQNLSCCLYSYRIPQAIYWFHLNKHSKQVKQLKHEWYRMVSGSLSD